MIKVIMTKTTKGSPNGILVLTYEKGVEYSIPKELAFAFVEEMKVAQYIDKQVKKISPGRQKKVIRNEAKFKRDYSNFVKEKDSLDKLQVDVNKKRDAILESGKIALRKLNTFGTASKAYSKLHAEFLKKPDKATKELLEKKLLEMGSDVLQVIASTNSYDDLLRKDVDFQKSQTDILNKIDDQLKSINKNLIDIDKV
jgi:hypothetical protein